MYGQAGWMTMSRVGERLANHIMSEYGVDGHVIDW